MTGMHPNQCANPRLFNGPPGAHYVVPQHLQHRMYRQQSCLPGNHHPLNVSRSDALSSQPFMMRGSVCNVSSAGENRRHCLSSMIPGNNVAGEVNMSSLGLSVADHETWCYSPGAIARPQQRDPWSYQIYPVGLQQQQQQQQQQLGLPRGTSLNSFEMHNALQRPLIPSNNPCTLEDTGHGGCGPMSLMNASKTSGGGGTPTATNPVATLTPTLSPVLSNTSPPTGGGASSLSATPTPVGTPMTTATGGNNGAQYSAYGAPTTAPSSYLNGADPHMMMMMQNSGGSLPNFGKSLLNNFETPLMPLNRASTLVSAPPASPTSPSSSSSSSVLHSKRLLSGLPCKNGLRLQQIKTPISGVHGNAAASTKNGTNLQNKHVPGVQQYMLVSLSPSASPSKTTGTAEVTATSHELPPLQHPTSRAMDSLSPRLNPLTQKSSVGAQASALHGQVLQVPSLSQQQRLIGNSPSQGPLEAHTMQGIPSDPSLLKCLRLPNDHSLDTSERSLSNASAWSFRLPSPASFSSPLMLHMSQKVNASESLLCNETSQGAVSCTTPRGTSPPHASSSLLVKTPTSHSSVAEHLPDYHCTTTLHSTASPGTTANRNSRPPTHSPPPPSPSNDVTQNFVKRFLLSSPLPVPQGTMSNLSPPNTNATPTARQTSITTVPSVPSSSPAASSSVPVQSGMVPPLELCGGTMLRSQEMHEPSHRTSAAQHSSSGNLTASHPSGWMAQKTSTTFGSGSDPSSPSHVVSPSTDKINPMLSNFLQNPKQQVLQQQVALGSLLHSNTSCSAKKLDHASSYTECFLRGLATVDRVADIITKLSSLLTGLSGTSPLGGVWKTECWRAHFEPDTLGSLAGCLVQGSSKFNSELWIRRYAEPAHLRTLHCLRMYSSEHIVAPNAPVNARRVMEAAVTPQFLKLLPYMGFRKSATNDVFVSALLFHHSIQGAEGSLLISVQKHYKDEKLSVDLFPGKYIVQVTGRVDDDKMIDALFQRILDLCHHIQPFVYFTKM